MNEISITNAYIHNLKNVNVKIPKEKFIVVTGVSGSGKSSLVFDLIYEESVSRYYHALGEINHSFKGRYFGKIEGLNPAIAVKQNTTRQSNPRSTVGTRCDINILIEYLYAQISKCKCGVCQTEYKINTECPSCGDKSPKFTASSFSPNSGIGMCLHCFGRGRIPNISEKEIFRAVYSSKQSLLNMTYRNLKNDLIQYAKKRQFDINKPYSMQPYDVQRDYLYGSKEYYFKGYIPFCLEVSADRSEDELGEMIDCPECGGSGINKEVQAFKIFRKNISELEQSQISEVYNLFESNLEAFQSNEQIMEIYYGIVGKLKDLCDVGLNYLSLNRKIPTLSGGELQRLFLAASFHVGLEELIYVFDEPSVGLHETEKINLVNKIKEFSKKNTVLVVEHDEVFLEQADKIYEFGPEGGEQGGKLIFTGTFQEMLDSEESVIGKNILESRKRIIDKSYNNGAYDRKLKMFHVTTNNLKDISVEIPLNKLVGIAGVSGSGKSSLLLDTLVPALEDCLDKKDKEDINIRSSMYLEGTEAISKCVYTSQKPIGRTKTSIPASYIGFWDEIRNLYAKQAQIQGFDWDAGYFSFNGEGACQKCNGDGFVQIGRITSICDVCGGIHYDQKVLQVKYKGLSIHDILQTTMLQALSIFKDNLKIKSKLMMVKKVGLEYLTLGQPISTISGGEAQRLKLSKELGYQKSRDIIYVLDEPSTGLSYKEENKLIHALEELVSKGNTVVVIEHDISFLAHCDWIIELGPGSGENGGKIIAEGTPERLCTNRNSLVADHLKRLMRDRLGIK